MIAHDVARWIIGGRRAGIIGRLVDDSAAGAVTKLWLQISVPLGVFGFTTTLNVMVATLAWLLDASAGIEPGVESAGELISVPFTSGEMPATSATAVPFRVVLPAT